MKSRSVILLIFRILLAAFFMISAIAKLFPLELFELRLISDGFAGWESARIIAITLISVEIIAGLSLLSPWSRRKIVYPGLLIFLTIMTGVLVRQLILVGNDSDCGCFGDWMSLTPAMSIAKNSAIMAFIVLLYKVDEDRTRNSRFLITAVSALLVTGITLYLAYPSPEKDSLPLADNIGAQASFAKEYQFSIGTADLGRGEKLVAFISAGCSHCKELAIKLRLLDESQEIPPVYFMIWGDQETIDEFFRVTRAYYPYVSFSMEEFFAFREKGFPRIYQLQDGKIVKQWDNRTFTGKGL